jgi:Galactose oxidase, central domain/Kelch motif
MNRLFALQRAVLAGTCATLFLALSACGGGVAPTSSAKTTPSAALKYVKVCINGEVAGKGSCPLEPALNDGLKPTDWGCTRDLDTGLTWEVSGAYRKNITRSPNNLFTNYTSTTFLQKELWTQPDPLIPQTTYFAYPEATEIASDENALGYANHLNAINAQDAFCGMKQWRIPHSSELLKLSIVYLQGTYKPGLPPIADNLLIDDYFPYTVNEPYLTSVVTNPRAGSGKVDGPDLYTDNVWFQGIGLASLEQPGVGSIYTYTERKHPRALRLVADACATCYPVADTAGTRWLTQSTVLNDGRVLVTGGSTSFAELYNPQLETWTTVQGLPATGLPVSRHTSTLLPNGKVLIVGGVDSSNQPIRKTWLFDSATNTFSAGPDTNARHGGHTATKLSNGNIVVAGGDCAYGAITCYSGSTELYNSVANSFTSLAPMPIPVKHAAAALLSGDKILVAGGASATVVSDAQVYDAATNTWRVLTTTLAGPRLYHTATTLNDGRVLIVGGYSAQAGTGGRWNSTDIYNPATDKISVGPSMQYRRLTHTATLLTDGKVLVTGGSGLNNDNTSTKTVEYFDPALNQWLEACSLITPRGGHSAALLTTGNILIAGGTETGVSISNQLTSAQIWRR